MKKSQPARATRMPVKMPLRATYLGVGAPDAAPSPTTVHQDRELKALREKLQGENSGRDHTVRARQDQVGRTLETIRAKFGEAAFQAAVKDFRTSFREFDKINLLLNKGPGITPADNLQPPP